MDLSVEYFTQIVTSLSADAKAESGHEQRSQPRAGLRARGMIIPLRESSSPNALSIQVRDLSQSGIGFLHDQKLELDEQFALVMPRANDTPAVVLCAVAFWQPLARDLFAIGARFTRILRDGGNPPLPIQVQAPQTNLAAEIQRLHRMAS